VPPAAGDDSAAAGEEPGEEDGIAFETPCRDSLKPWYHELALVPLRS